MYQIEFYYNDVRAVFYEPLLCQNSLLSVKQYCEFLEMKV